MRQEADTYTAEIPGLPPLPPPAPRRITIGERRLQLVFQGPKERPSCANCRHVESVIRRPDAFDESAELKCLKGCGFVPRGAWCVEHEE